MTEPVDDSELPPPAAEPLDRSRNRQRTWPQRLVLAFNVSLAFGCLIAAAVIWYANDQLSQRKLVDISDRAGVATTTIASTPDGSAPPATTPTGDTVAPTDETTTTLPVIDVDAKNFLLTGSDNRSCIDPDSPYAGAYLGSGSDTGERSDTIMMLRVDPKSNQAVVLSFPRDLWVKIAGSNKSSRINAAFDADNPTKLMDTIWENFGILTDHYINVDFCAFKDIVDAVGGVAVPFEFAARDANTGLNITEPECHVFGGDEALAYVRSRHYKWFDPATGEWESDGTSDYGRITRQQDFLKRAMQKALDGWTTNPGMAQGLLEAFKNNVQTDTELSIDVLLDFADAMRSYDASGLRTFQVAGTGVVKGTAQVIEPNLTSLEMQAVLYVFRGWATLADAPTAPVDPGDIAEAPEDTSADAVTTTAPDASAPSTTVGTTTEPAASTSTTLVLTVNDIQRGISPPDDPSCR